MSIKIASTVNRKDLSILSLIPKLVSDVASSHCDTELGLSCASSLSSYSLSGFLSTSMVISIFLRIAKLGKTEYPSVRGYTSRGINVGIRLPG